MSLPIRHSCPNCEYEKAKPGRPVTRGDKITCLDCGTSWKEISSNPVKNSSQKNKIDIEALRILARGGTTHPFSGDIDPLATAVADVPSIHISSFKNALLCFLAAFIVIGLGSVYWFSHNPLHSIDRIQTSSVHAVSVSDVKLKERTGRSGKKIITVTGKVENTTQNTKKIPPIKLSLHRSDGKEIIHWRYTSGLSQLKSGGRIRFSSSIQYDEPIISYAKAVFE